MASLSAHLVCRQTIKVRAGLGEVAGKSHDAYNLWLTDSLFVLFVGLGYYPANSSMSSFQTAQGHAFPKLF